MCVYHNHEHCICIALAYISMCAWVCLPSCVWVKVKVTVAYGIICCYSHVSLVWSVSLWLFILRGLFFFNFLFVPFSGDEKNNITKIVSYHCNKCCDRKWEKSRDDNCLLMFALSLSFSLFQLLSCNILHNE